MINYLHFTKKINKQNTNMYHHRNASLSFNVMTLYLLKVMKRTEKIHFHKYKQKISIPDKTNIELLSSFMLCLKTHQFIEELAFTLYLFLNIIIKVI